MKIILSNDLPQDKKIKIKESNAGIFRFLANLAPGQVCTLKHDPHATYREYFLIMLPDRTRLRVLTSDDFKDFKEISIYEANGVYDWRGVPRNGAPGRGAVLVNPSVPLPAPRSAPPPPIVRDSPAVNLPAASTSTAPTGQGRGKVANFFHKIGIRF